MEAAVGLGAAAIRGPGLGLAEDREADIAVQEQLAVGVELEFGVVDGAVARVEDETLPDDAAIAVGDRRGLDDRQAALRAAAPV